MRKYLLIMLALCILVMAGCEPNNEVIVNSDELIDSGMTTDVVVTKSFEERTSEANSIMNTPSNLDFEGLGYVSLEHFVSNASLRKDNDKYLMKLSISSSKLFDKTDVDNALEQAKENGTSNFDGYTFYKDRNDAKKDISSLLESQIPVEVIAPENEILVKNEAGNPCSFVAVSGDSTKYVVAELALAGGASGFIVTEVEKEIEVELTADDVMKICPVNESDEDNSKEITVKRFYDYALNNVVEEGVLEGFTYSLDRIGDDRGIFAEYVNAVEFKDGKIMVNFKNGGL